mmetsp:Transcript_15165/g.37408  ORF Transcript_15165/g.37408 Transcript_15165/m.37408 type:complete len:722 (+) Transcript_15165:205-2370(+)
MLAHWVARVGSIIAPDENIEEIQQQQPSQQEDADFWQILAPDPNFQRPPAPPSAAFPNLMDQNDVCVECEHCHRSTRLPLSVVASIKNAASTSTPAAGDAAPGRVSFQTPSPRIKNDRANNSSRNDDNTGFATTPGGSTKKEAVESLVLSAAKDTSMAFGSPLNSSVQTLFTLCSNTKELKPKKYNSIQKALAKTPSLLEQRSRGLGVSCPDGYTLLMAAARANHVKAAEIIMDAATSSGRKVTVLDARTFEGQSALHIASKSGAMDMVGFLVPLYDDSTSLEGQDPTVIDSGAANERTATPGREVPITSMPSSMPVDLLGRTPLGTGLLSPDARKHHKQLKSKLLTPRDESMFGEFVPYEERMGSVMFDSSSSDSDTNNPSVGGITWGVGDIPGIRVETEDSICNAALSTNIDVSDSNSDPPSYYVLGVCDGHSDKKAVSDFVARSIPPVLKECIGPTRPPFSDGESHDEVAQHWGAIWSSAAMKVDDSLRSEGIPGGSTGVFAMISRDAIVVANVGDSRCILIQSSVVSEAEGEEGSSAAALQEGLAVPMSEDHKPNLPVEKARIENAGLEVYDEDFINEDGTVENIYKVRKSATDMLGVSRAFGDFEYKDNTSLNVYEQAVSCEPDVVVRKRDPKRDLYLVLCCDGIFDVMSNDDVKDFLMEQVQKSVGDAGEVLLPQVADMLCRKCFDLGSEDNMSVIVVSLQSNSLPSPRKTLTYT